MTTYEMTADQCDLVSDVTRPVIIDVRYTTRDSEPIDLTHAVIYVPSHGVQTLTLTELVVAAHQSDAEAVDVYRPLHRAACDLFARLQEWPRRTDVDGIRNRTQTGIRLSLSEAR